MSETDKELFNQLIVENLRLSDLVNQQKIALDAAKLTILNLNK